MNDGGKEYNDEAGMVKNDLHTIIRVSTHLEKDLANNENMPEWVQEKIAQCKGMIVAAMDYMISQHEQGKIYYHESKKFHKKKKAVKESTQLAKSLMKDFQNFKKNN